MPLQCCMSWTTQSKSWCALRGKAEVGNCWLQLSRLTCRIKTCL